MPGRTSSYRAYYVGETQGRTSQPHLARRSHDRNLTLTGTGSLNWQPDMYPLTGKSGVALGYMDC